jgi:5-methylcytosine-specific restriction enzyme A
MSTDKYDFGQIEAAFDAARAVQRGHKQRSQVVEELVAAHSFDRSNASIFVDAIRSLFEGRVYKMALGVSAADYCVERISREDGIDGRRRAVAAYKANIEYYESLARRKDGAPGHRRDHRKLLSRLESGLEHEPVFPDEVNAGAATLREGATQSVMVNQYERNASARRLALNHWGHRCCVCGFDFERRYGAIGRGFIHVHHVVDIASIGVEYEIDPVNDLRPVCPNCHAMLHTQRPAMSVEELRQMLRPVND